MPMDEDTRRAFELMDQKQDRMDEKQSERAKVIHEKIDNLTDAIHHARLDDSQRITKVEGRVQAIEEDVGEIRQGQEKISQRMWAALVFACSAVWAALTSLWKST